MNSRRDFLLKSGIFCTGALVAPNICLATPAKGVYGVQLYSFRDDMAKDAKGTLQKIADLGIKEIESAKSAKGHYYGLSPKEMKNTCQELGMKLKSGHVHLDKDFERTMEEAAAADQEYLICSSIPYNGQNVANYKKVADAFNKAGEACKKLGIKFGYHNHEYEFESDNGQVLYDILMDNTEPDLVHMELDLGWVIIAKKDPLHYFEKYPGRFPLWHLKDMDMVKKESTEFGKGGLDIPLMMQYRKLSGVKHIFIEQEEYTNNPIDSIRHNMDYLAKL